MNQKEMRRLIIAISIIILLLAFAVIYYKYSFVCEKGVKVIDGDTIMLCENNRQIRIRYACIDAPEKDEPFYFEAKKKNEELLHNKSISYQKIDVDKYKRIVALVNTTSQINNEVINLNINYELLKSGYALYYDVSRKCSRYPNLLLAQRYAYDNNLGIWSIYKRFSTMKVIKGGKNFHLPGCEVVEFKPHKIITLKDAIYQGLHPCRKCKPLLKSLKKK